MKQNPEASFAIEESFPFKSLYGETVPLGPILQLGAGEQSSGFSEESAQATLEYWRTAAVGVIARSSLSESEREAYAKMAAAQAGLLAAKSFSSEAEETYRIAVDLAPSSPELAYRFANFLAEAGRAEEARQVLQKLPAPHQQSATP
jgi:thioredoxin-like negative regulator of GroEL